MRFAKGVFLVAGIYGLLVMTPLYFLESRIGRDTPPPITHPEYFYGFVGVTLAWQFLFLIVASDPARYRLMIIPSILAKVSFGSALLVLFSQRRIPASVLGIGSLDWVFAILFAAAFSATQRGAAVISGQNR